MGSLCRFGNAINFISNCDLFSFYSICFLSLISCLPTLGLIDMAQPIYVKRESHESRTQTIHDIMERVRSDDVWPQIFIFPEGTCSNGQVMIDFKPGAFIAGVPVQPVLIRYPNKIDTVSPFVVYAFSEVILNVNWFCFIYNSTLGRGSDQTCSSFSGEHWRSSIVMLKSNIYPSTNPTMKRLRIQRFLLRMCKLIWQSMNVAFMKF